MSELKNLDMAKVFQNENYCRDIVDGFGNCEWGLERLRQGGGKCFISRIDSRKTEEKRIFLSLFLELQRTYTNFAAQIFKINVYEKAFMGPAPCRYDYCRLQHGQHDRSQAT